MSVPSAHLVGHSHGGVITLQFALDYSASVRTLSLLEPVLVGFIPDAKVIQQKFLDSLRHNDNYDRKRQP